MTEDLLSSKEKVWQAPEGLELVAALRADIGDGALVLYVGDGHRYDPLRLEAAKEIDRLTARMAELLQALDEQALGWRNLVEGREAERDRMRVALEKITEYAWLDESGKEVAAPPWVDIARKALAGQPDETGSCRKHGIVFDNPGMGCPRCAAENGTGCS